MAYQERMATEDDPILNKPGTSLTIEKKPKNKGSKKKTCYRFLEGKCPFGEKCFRYHDTFILKMFDKKSKNIEKKTDSNGSKASSGGGGNNESFVAASLPIQDFRQ